MELIRTDSSGIEHDNKRLLILKSIIDYFDITSISKIHDHKGNLEVTWINEPKDFQKEIINEFWEAFGESEIEHIIKYDKLKQDYIVLYEYLIEFFGGESVKLINEIIKVDCSTGLFNYHNYEFYSRDVEKMPISIISKSINEDFYCEFENTTTVIISY